MTEDTWRDQAACLDVDVEIFVESDRGVRPVEAMRYCVRCDVREECLDEALAVPPVDDMGVWGGTTARDRQSIRSGRLDRHDAMVRGNQAAAARTDAEIAATSRAPHRRAADARLARRRGIARRAAEPDRRPVIVRATAAAADVARHHGLTLDDLVATGGREPVTAARRAAMAAAAAAGATTTEVGQIFGDRHHTTVVRALAHHSKQEIDRG